MINILIQYLRDSSYYEIDFNVYQRFFGISHNLQALLNVACAIQTRGEEELVSVMKPVNDNGWQEIQFGKRTFAGNQHNKDKTSK